jgi:hypothetical protein
MCEGAGIDEHEILVDLSFLKDIGYIEAMSSSSFSITTEGYEYHRGVAQDELI